MHQEAFRLIRLTFTKQYMGELVNVCVCERKLFLITLMKMFKQHEEV